MTPAIRLTRSLSTSFRSLVTAVAGWPSVSSRMTSSLRPPICMPRSCQYSSHPLYMSFPAWAMAPEIGEADLDRPLGCGPPGVHPGEQPDHREQHYDRAHSSPRGWCLARVPDSLPL